MESDCSPAKQINILSVTRVIRFLTHLAGGPGDSFENALCFGNCEGCSRATSSSASRQPTKIVPASSREMARRGLQRLQSVMGVLFLLSAVTGSYLLATDSSLWLLAVSHAVGLVIIVIMDVILGLYNLASSKSAYLPSIAAAFLGFALQAGDVFTAPQYDMTIPYFARYLFGLWAFDLLLGLQLAIVIVGVTGRPHARYLARRKTRRGRELDYSRRGFMKALVGFAGLLGLGVVIGSIKLPAQASPTIQTVTGTQTGALAGSVANVKNLQVGVPVYFEYPSGYPNALIKNADGTLIAVSMLCTHVCCECSFDAALKVFYCPCHGSVFDLSGKVVRGPAVDDLPVIQLRTDGSGNLFPTGVTNPGPCQA
jgi:Rieske Fe-S protein